jgi:pimeloyl-ACP methyl ester carboxylesterase
MKKLLRRLGLSVLGTFVVWLAVNAAMVVFGTARPPMVNSAITRPFASIDDSGLPPLSTYRARDGAELSFREYPAGERRVAVLIHGSAGSSIDMHPLALALQRAGVTVYVPDIRGQGADRPHGDIAYVGQLEDDLADLMSTVRPAHGSAEWTLVGFSSGGGFALRVAAERPLGQSFDRYILLSPYLKYNAPSLRGRDDPPPGTQGGTVQAWTALSLGRIIGLSGLNTIGVHRWDGLPVIHFAVPADVSSVTTAYSWRLLQDFEPHDDYLADIRAVARPMHVYVGSADQLFVAARMRTEFQAQRPDIAVSTVPGMGHSDMVTRPEAIAVVVAEFPQ